MTTLVDLVPLHENADIKFLLFWDFRLAWNLSSFLLNPTRALSCFICRYWNRFGFALSFIYMYVGIGLESF